MYKILKFLLLTTLSVNILNSSAENVQIDKFGFQNQPIIFKVSQEYSNNTKINWDFGDNNKETGKEVIHRYNKLGEFEVKTEIQNNLIKEESVSKINIVEKSAILINNITDKQNTALKNFAKLNDFYIENIKTEQNNNSIKNLELKNLIERLDIEKFNYLIIWSNNPNDLDFIYTLNKENKEKIKSKNLIFITDDIQNIYLQRKVSNIGFKNSVIAGKEVIYDLIEIKKYESFLTYITDRDYKFINLDKSLILKQPYLVLTIITDALLDSGLNPEVLYIILLLPILYGFMSITNNIIGIRFLNKYSFISFVIGSIVGSVEIMLLFFLLAIILGLVNKITLDKLNLLKIPKENLNLGLFVTFGLLTLTGLEYFELIMTNELSSYSVSLIIASFGINQIYTNISQRKILKNLKVIMINLFAWSLLSIYFGGNNLLFQQNFGIKQKVLSNPEIILVFLGINFIAMIYSGLRVTEYITYKKIYENLEE